MENGEAGSDIAADPAPSILLAVAGFAARATWVGGLLLSCLVGLLWYFQEKLLFYPGVPQGFETPDKNPKGLRSPAERGLPFEELWVKTVDGVKLHCWLIKQKLPQVAAHAPTLIFFHGNAGNVGFRLPNVELLYKHVGVNVLLVSYRGYGYSEGSPTEAGVYRDGEAALDMLVEKQKELQIDANRLFLFGRSLGGAVAIDLAVQRSHQIRGVIVENTFTSLIDMILIVFPFLRPFQRLVRVVQRLYMDNGEKMKRLRLPILFISGMKDELVPSRHMKQLFEWCASPLKEKEEVPLGGHNDTWEWAIGGKNYYERIAAFIQQALQFDAKRSQEPSEDTLLGHGGPDSSCRDSVKAPALQAGGSLPAEKGGEHDLPLSVAPGGAAVLPAGPVSQSAHRAHGQDSLSLGSVDLPAAPVAAREVVAAAAAAASSAAVHYATSGASRSDSGSGGPSAGGVAHTDVGNEEIAAAGTGQRGETTEGLRQRVAAATCQVDAERRRENSDF
ncbi:phospholipase/carboxylesterase [Besnoitia besnoiti]|uniref:Phospholipase/carboxylesterase n=1 Tax=Besnoitia besnoiti TaxID=94643 RepID=A0A2A9MB50_BESBE|nr:phospholipase/carboxylesterase [Besnoitia besnoiti]PFH32610.1 phospholipase/carboxylesterase [Besnoitia besnoiti]